MSMSMSNSLIDKIYDLVKPTTAKNFKEDSLFWMEFSVEFNFLCMQLRKSKTD